MAGYGVSGNADDAFGNPDIVRLRVGNERPAEVPASSKADDLSAVGVAEVIREAFGEHLPSGRNRRVHRAGALPLQREEQLCPLEHREQDDDREEGRDGNQDSLAS